MEIVDKLRAKDRRAIAKAISALEDNYENSNELLKSIFKYTGNAHIIGVTGAPGVGKSTLISSLVKEFRKLGKTVGIVAIDPTSPFTGGAVLGDRVRMGEHSCDPGVYIRSMGTRGSLGGLSKATNDAVKVLDAAGFDIIIIETVGTGQSEIDVVRAADTIVVVIIPGLGDDIQAIKAGILEIADIFVVNKCDREGVERAVSELEMMLDLKDKTSWRPPIIKTNAKLNEGTAQLADAISKHYAHLISNGELVKRRQARYSEEIREVVNRRISQYMHLASGKELFDSILDKVLRKELDPHSAADLILNEIVKFDFKKNN
ncbi:MAG: methylmalonyl Co-A mutase-associated GTPase MeaB [Thermoplasmata archaeon]